VPQEFCSTCLALALNVSLQTVRNDLGRLAQELVLVRVGGTCAVCSRRTATYGLMPERDEPAEEIVAQLFAASPARTALCYSCLAQEARLSYHDAQRGAARLRAAGVTRLSIGCCTRCGRHRALVQPGVGGL
jgi:DeoR-like helix-turn-helix domain